MKTTINAINNFHGNSVNIVVDSDDVDQILGQPLEHSVHYGMISKHQYRKIKKTCPCSQDGCRCSIRLSR